MTDRPRRRRRIADLIGRGGVGSQERLRALLRKDGIAVTQATLSRDLREMGVVKGATGYALPSASPAEPAASLGSVLASNVLRVERAGTVVVLHTGPGRAPVVALEIDRAAVRGVVGTVAGDDTVFVAAPTGAAASGLTHEFRRAAGLGAAGAPAAHEERSHPLTARAAIVGAAGYGGVELLSFLLAHPSVEVVGLFGSEGRTEETPVAAAAPRLRGRTALAIRPASVDAVMATKPDVVFLATPNEASHSLAPRLLDAGMTVLDLSGAFRLRDAGLYPQFYGFSHEHRALLEEAVYGLPELNRGAIAKARLIAVPGCYPTSAILALAPLVRAGAVERGRRPIVDSISGVSGAGKTPTTRTHFCEVSVQPYNVLKHRHNPEIDQHAGTPVVFTPHLGPYSRGIVSTIHVELAPGWTGARVGEAYRAAYSGEPFVRLLPSGEWPSALGVERTNFCDIGWAADEPHRHLIVVSAIDNLVKGAAGQAVQCMNIRLGIPEGAGLEGIER